MNDTASENPIRKIILPHPPVLSNEKPPCHDGVSWGGAVLGGSRSRTFVAAHKQGDDSDHQEDEETDLRNESSGAGDDAETEDCGDDGDYEEHDCVVKHGMSVVEVVLSRPRFLAAELSKKEFLLNI
jgi:hypothetical protein